MQKQHKPAQAPSAAVSKKLLIAIVVVLLLVLIVFGALLVVLFTRDSAPASSQPTAQQSGGVGLQIDKNAGEYVAAPVASQAPSQGIAIPGWGGLNFAAGQTEQTVDFYNPEANAGLYYLTFELRLPDASPQGYEVLYTSGLVEPNMHIQSITLSRPLEAGEYDAVIHVQPYRMDETKSPTNNADMKTVLYVQ